MAIIEKISDLPPKILAVVDQQDQVPSFGYAIKTNYKPNATIPILWLILTKTDLLLCNTHKTRGLTARHAWSEINEVRMKQNTGKVGTLEIIFNDLSKDDIVLPLPAEVTAANMAVIIKACADFKQKSG